MAPLEVIREKLNRAQTAFCRAADEIPSDKWAQQPALRQWSAAEVVAHLVVVERSIVGKSASLLPKAPRPVPFRSRWHLPMWFVEARIVRRKSPLPLDPALLSEKEAMLGTLRGVREHTLAFLKGNESRDLGRYYWRHPFLGMLNIYNWMEMIAAHQLRHTKQVHEIREKVSRK
jgi:DinB superfamily